MWRLKMANICFSGPKAPKDEARKALMEKGAEVTDNRYIVSFESDDTGSHMVLRVERNLDGTSGIRKEFMETKFLGWRVVYMNVPDDYIKWFFNDNGTRKVTQSANE
tara:strand:+ start:158 stop:478 length:321 start_codon:yes stop_codon:yes gene_type:complete